MIQPKSVKNAINNSHGMCPCIIVKDNDYFDCFPEIVERLYIHLLAGPEDFHPRWHCGCINV